MAIIKCERCRNTQGFYEVQRPILRDAQGAIVREGSWTFDPATGRCTGDASDRSGRGQPYAHMCFSFSATAGSTLLNPRRIEQLSNSNNLQHHDDVLKIWWFRKHKAGLEGYISCRPASLLPPFHMLRLYIRQETGHQVFFWQAARGLPQSSLLQRTLEGYMGCRSVLFLRQILGI
ncbi:hypothetical protein C8F01DRAFT_4595 [Mycena amicta]|nr:hypothetical protein C8F01DRAFT_4595 [Mycena amicta]